MFTHKDIEFRTIFVVNCVRERNLRVSNGELLLEEKADDSSKVKTLTKLPFQKILALFIVGHITITTPLIDKCQKYGVALIVMKPNFRPVFFWSNPAEANYLLRQRQYQVDKEDLTIARVIISNKICNQIKTLLDTRRKDSLTESAVEKCRLLLPLANTCTDYSELMGIEGAASREFFAAFFQQQNWKARRPRTKCDVINATLDIGYTILFNYIECFLRLFGFDLYVGVFHRLWFRRKSLVCDLIEPFRCLIDKAVRTAFNRKQFTEKDFDFKRGEYYLKLEKNKEYQRFFFEVLIPYKRDVFSYVQAYYRCFMQKKSVKKYPQFLI
ncbi:CRISPR-associated protein Cas1 [Porphyromonas crevioricanis]|uniref:type V CRISPR-associated endonuclease Cas1 n=1 Tax=Porphyromonas crevioricanis TaxID=393921 RepID=UPI00052BDFD5|nr:type V CRISPR-associated endonuclease Cas1 [Porphyromonas crevioricanis]KGN90797.1 CRISPR-associated protein Cas1 [Porphyromonas crevioricanis]